MATKSTYVEVEVDLDEFELDDIVDYLYESMDGGVSSWRLQKLRDKIKKLYPEIIANIPKPEPVDLFPTYMEQKKFEAFAAGMGNRTLEEIEQFFTKSTL